MRARRWNRYRTQVYGSLCTSGGRRPRGAPGGTLQVGTYPDSPLPDQRGRSHGV